MPTKKITPPEVEMQLARGVAFQGCIRRAAEEVEQIVLDTPPNILAYALHIFESFESDCKDGWSSEKAIAELKFQGKHTIPHLHVDIFQAKDVLQHELNMLSGFSACAVYMLRARGSVPKQDARGFSIAQSQKLAEMYNFSADECIAVEDVICGERRVRAIPASLIRERKHSMWGGNFVYTPDSRWFHNAIKIHDRVE